ncbi:hypothetical protein XM38_036450 [Halomicronema hongdechloris C2206]|uniref:Uncharacterized protein n=1 Tax=Halomicronema hongdechloris C2206 TaxID=1641165 RepID=A0A1Z3HRC1_9CYAN|nr:hypothetical protein XM38_036450 [Halomicronema hongdechloris C2206]
MAGLKLQRYSRLPHPGISHDIPQVTAYRSLRQENIKEPVVNGHRVPQPRMVLIAADADAIIAAGASSFENRSLSAPDPGREGLCPI